VHDLTSTVGLVALGAGAVAVVALVATLSVTLALRRVRSEQRAVLGERREDLVSHAVSLQDQFVALHDYVQDVAEGLHGRMGKAEQRLDGAISHSSLVRYDAYGEMSGRQSITIALLDATHTGIVLSSIHHRDQARLYAKQVQAGHSEIELSPEEAEAVQLALQHSSGEQPATR